MVFSGSGAGETIVGQLRGIEVVFGRISGATLVVVAVGTGARCEICAHPHLSSRMAKEGALLFVFASPFFPLRSRSFLSLLGSSVLLCPFLLISLPPSPFLGCSDVLI